MWSGISCICSKFEMNDMKELNKSMRQIIMIGQFGLSFIMPTLICVLLCAFLCNRFGIGTWLYIPAFILGLGSSFTTAYKFYKSVIKKGKNDDKNVKASFNRHD